MTDYLLVLPILLTLVAAYVNVNYPLNLQLPPVAHVGAPYQFQFASTTFQSDSDKLQYSLTGNPSWLSLDSNSRTLSGTPRDGDNGEASFSITAAGAAGNAANMPSKLLVTNVSGPKPKANITQVLSSAGQLSDLKTIVLGPSKPFSISFPLDTFDSSSGQLSYSALLSDRTPLPAWISFDATSLRFSGTTPPVTTSQSFEIILIASDVTGYTASSSLFTMAVNFHQLVFQPFSQNVDLGKGADVRLSGIKNKLLLDGVPIVDSDLQTVSAKMPDWLKLDSKTVEISGKAPSDLMSQDITVTAKDRFGDSAQLRIRLNFKSDLFGAEVGQLNITAGKKYSFTLPSDIFSQKGQIPSLDFSSLSEYLHFDAKTLTISGEIPDDHAAGTVQCTLTVTSSDGSRKDSQAFTVSIGAAMQGGSSNLEPADDPTPTEEGKAAGRKKAGIIIGAVIASVVVLVLLAILILCLRQRRKKQSYISPKLPRSPRKSDISRPTFIPYGWPDIDLSDDQDLEHGKNDAKEKVDRTPEHPPKLDLDLSDDRKDSHSLTDSIGEADTRILDSFDESAWGLQNDIAPSQHPHGSMKIPTAELAKRASSRSDTYRKHKRRTTTIYQDHIHRSSGLPVNRRITGMGHGRHTYSPSRSNINFPRSHAPRPLSTSTYTTTRCTSTLSTAPSALPQSPVVRKHLTKVTIPREERRSIRIVPASIRGSFSDRRTLDEKRLSYIRSRASAQSPFFAGDGIRESSGSYKTPPAFIKEVASPTKLEHTHSVSPAKADVIVRPDDDVPEGKGKELPNISHPRKPSTSTALASSTRVFPGSLRQNRTRPVTAIKSKPDRVEKYYNRSETFGHWKAGMRRRASTRESLRAYDLKTSLNNLTGSEIFKDADLSDSEYTDEEDNIEEAERRQTMKPGHFTLPPLNVNTKRRSKRKSDEKKRVKKDDGKRELKRASERDPTPYYYASPLIEHGGKENQSSTYTLGTRSSPIRNEPKRQTIATESPIRIISAGVPPQARPASDIRKIKRSSAIQPQAYYQERHSRKSIHSRAQSRASGTGKKPRDHSRQQSTAYPFFDTTSIDMKRSSIGNAISTAADAVCMPTSKASLVQRDLSGNLTFYHNSDEEPTIEELRSSSIGIRSSNGQISHNAARQSRLASLHESSPTFPQRPQPPRKSSKRDTAILVPRSEASNASVGGKPTGLGLFPVDMRAELIAAGAEGREKSPLGMVQGENKERVGGEDEVVKGRQTWGSLKTMVGRGSKWISGGYWEKQGRDDRVFI